MIFIRFTDWLALQNEVIVDVVIMVGPYVHVCICDAACIATLSIIFFSAAAAPASAFSAHRRILVHDLQLKEDVCMRLLNVCVRALLKLCEAVAIGNVCIYALWARNSYA